MRDNVLIRETGDQKYVISQEDAFSFRAALYNGRPYLCVTDIAKCCGYKAPGKVAARTGFDMVKLDTHLRSGGKSLTVAMWYMTLDDAIEFVKEKSMKESFSRWFLQDVAKELKALDAPRLSAEPEPRPASGVNIPERIDRLIIELLTLKQEISPTT